MHIQSKLLYSTPVTGTGADLRRLLCPGQVRSGQVRSECLTCTFRASCCSARLSWAQVPTFAGSSVRDRSGQVRSGQVRGPGQDIYQKRIVITVLIEVNTLIQSVTDLDGLWRLSGEHRYNQVLSETRHSGNISTS